ncbi:MAG: dihydroorotate dehydrogenase [Nitrososphaerota archaeon]|nr:dihydroorotate dehydrogenase [Nitrososphaerota archaeon]
MTRSIKGRASQSHSKIMPPSIGIDICGFHLISPTMIASGVLGISFDLFPRIIANGCGAIVSKSIGQEPRNGYKNPTMTGVESGYLNAIGLANPGVEAFAEELKAELRGTPLIVSIFSGSPEGFASLAERLDEFPFLAYELNLSCPHVKEVGSEIGVNADEAAKVVQSVKRVTSKPVLAKMPATIPEVGEWGKIVERAGADAIVAINTVRAMKIEVESRKPILSNRIGGLSGPAIRPIGVRVIYELYEAVSVPVIGVGGVSDWKTAAEYLLAGAAAVQVGSAMGQSYLSTFGEINKGLAQYLRRQNFSTITEMIGAAHN